MNNMMEPKIRFKGFEGEWKALSLDDCVNFLDSKRKPIEEGNRTKGIFPYYGASGIVDYINDYIFDEELILLSEDGANITDRNYPVCFLAKGKYWVNNHAHVLKAKEGFINSFLCNAMERKDYTLYNTGMAMPKLNKEACKRIPVLHPSSNEQQAIATYFTTLDSQISASTSRLTSLKQMKAASLQAMFPQKGETVPKIRFKGFEGEWKTCVLSSIATMHARIGWQNLRKDEFLLSGDYYLITGTDFHDGKISFETCHYIDKERYDQDKNIQLEIDSILITKDGTLGKVAFVDSLDKPATLNAGVFNVRTKDKEIYPKYLFQYLKAPYLMDYVNKNATGGTIKHLNQNMLVNFPVQYPSYKEQVMIGDYLFNLDRQISLQSQRLEKLKQIKSACLDKMFV